MEVIEYPKGRLGNGVFRYLAGTLFCIIYKAVRSQDNNMYHAYMSDDWFIVWKQSVEQGIIPHLEHRPYIFYGYYQTDKVYVKYLSEIKEYIRSHPHDKIRSDNNQIYYAIQLLEAPSIRVYDTVIHIRLEDFIRLGFVIHPIYFKQLLVDAGITKACIVVNMITSELEEKYINYLKQYCEITLESNDVITDYHIMRNAKTLICSNSTISWVAALLSETVTTVYMPNYPATRTHETFRNPITNTIHYEYKMCSKEELEVFLQPY